MAKQTTEAIITLNGKQPIDVLNQMHNAAEKIKVEMEQVQQKMKGMSPKDDAYKQLNGTLKELKGQYDLLSSAQVKDIEATKRLQSAVESLSSTSLKNLRKALGDGKRQLEGLSEAEIEQSDSLRSMMKIVGDQIRLLEGKYVKIREGLVSIGTQSDQWLDKAIAQQQELLATTRRGTKEYKEQEQVMQMLTAEQNKRNAAISAEAAARRQAQFKQQVASSRQMLSSGNLGSYSLSEIQTSINTLKQAQNQAAVGGSEWQSLAAEIKKAEEELDRLMGKAKEVKRQMSEGDARNILGNIGGHTEQEVREAINALRMLQSTVNVGGSQWNAYAADIEKAEAELGKMTGRIKEAKQGLSMSDVEGRMQNLNEQSERSLKEMLDYLQKAKAELVPYTQQWSEVASKLDAVKKRMEDVQSNVPYLRNENSAQAIAHKNRLDFGNGYTHDVTRKDLQWSKDFLQKQLDVTPVADTAKIQQIQEALGLIDERMKALNGDTEKSAMSTEKLNEVLGDMKTASLKDLRDASAELKKQLDGLAPSSSAAKQVRKQMQDLDREIKQVEDDMVDVNDVIARSKKGEASINELKKAYKQLEEELNQLNTKSEEFADKQKEMKDLKKNIDEVTGAAKKQGGAWQTALKNLTAYVGLFAVFNKAKEIVTSAIKKNIEYSGSLTDIRKVSGLTMEEVEKLSTELAKIDTRTSVEGLAKLAFEGSKLGMSKYGVEGLASFVRAADQINVAIGEEMGEEALPALSKMVEVMGLIPKMGIEKAMLATGSAMFKLSTTSTSTSNDIVEFAKRLTGVARTAGITTDQLLALGSASSSMMLMPEVASTAMGKFIVALQKNHNLIAKELGIPDETIKNLYASGHAMDAIVLVLEKMKQKGNMNALGGIFKDLGSDGQRLVTAMVTMSKNVDMLKDHLYESQEAFEEATAVTSEYEMQQQSAIGILERANNLWEKAFVNPDGVESVKTLSQAWYDMSVIMTQSPIFKGTLNAALTLLIISAKTLVVLLPAIINYLVAMGVWKTVAFFAELTKAIWAAVTAQNALNASAKVNPYVALTAILMTAAGVITSFANQANEAARAQEEATRKANEWKDKLKDAEKQTDDLTRKLHSYKVAIENVALSQKDRNAQISRFNRDFRQYISKLGIEIKNVSDLRKHYSALAQEIQRATYYRLREEAKQDALPDYQKDRLNAANRLKSYIKDNDDKYGGFSTNDIIRWFVKGADANAAYKYMIQGSLKNTIVGGRKVDLNDIKFNFRTGEYSYDRKSKYGASTGRDKELLDRLTYLYNATNRETNKSKEIDEYFSPFVPKDYTPWVEDTPGTLENDAPDKDAIAQEKRDKRDRERAWREELKQKQDEANAIMDNVRNFYERQINAKMEEAVSLGMDKTEQDLFVEPVKRRMNEALEQVRLAIAGQANTWEQFKLTMKDDLIEQTDETGINLSEGLLEAITSNNIDALREKLTQLGESLNRPLNSILAEVFAKATKNAQANLALQLKQQEARRKAIQEHDYTGVVQQNMYDTFNTMGYANPTEAEVADKDAFDKRKANIIAMYETARKEIVSLYKIDTSTKDGQGALLQLLFGDDPDGMGKRIAETLGDDAKEWQAFYQKLLQYNDEYTAAEKKNADERKEINDFLWKRQAFQANQDKRRHAMQQVGSGIERFRKAGKGEDSDAPRSGEMGGSKFMDEFSYNANIEQSKLEIILLQEKIAFLQQYEATSEQVAELQKSLAEKQDAYILSLMQTMKQRAEAIYALYKPLEDFGTAAGQAFATMTEDAEEGRDAFKAAIGDMINSMMKQTVQMTQEYIKRRLMQKVNDKLVSTQIKKSTKEQVSLEQGGADATSAITKAAGDAKVMLTEQVGQQVVNAVNTQTQATTATAQSAAVTDVNTQAAKTEANVGLGIAEGSAKTIGSLGWWGIPLIAVITAVLNGLLGFAMGKVSSLFGKGKENNTNTKNTKVVSGMLTYDHGNVQDLKPFVGNDGSLYWAAEEDKPHNGVSLLTQPTATTINGQPSLVAENGPELVIGRETTQAMMMNNPQLLKALVNYDRNYSGRHTYDAGNVSESAAFVSSGASATDEVVSNNTATSAALLGAINALLSRLDKPINAEINMYGRGGLHDSMTKANQFMKNKK